MSLMLDSELLEVLMKYEWVYLGCKFQGLTVISGIISVPNPGALSHKLLDIV